MFCSCARSKMTQVSHHPWGEWPGQGAVDLWVVQSPQVKVEVLTLGAIIRSVSYRGNDGQMEDVVLGYDNLEGRRESNLCCYLHINRFNCIKSNEMIKVVNLSTNS